MADKRNPDDPKFDWLYSGRSQEDEAKEGRPAADPDATQQLRPTDDDNRTQVFGVAPRGDEPAAGQRATKPQPDESGAGGADSFGGTYAAPPAGQQGGQRSDAAFAPPSAHQGAGKRQPGPAGPKRPTRPRRGRARLWWRGILLLVLAWVVFLVAVPI